jgi:signal transduction histidine kinase
MADRTRVKQVLINLLSNAIKYNRVGGTVTVECTLRALPDACASACATPAGPGARQAGPAVPALQPAGQGGRAEEGTGIGLVVTQAAGRTDGRQIGADSTVGVGSLFWVELP